MQLAIPLEKMTTADKLKALEEIWSDLQRTPDEVPSPAWHADVLRAREARVKEGSSQFQDWPTAKRRIREQTQ
ncbi:MAG: addiction module protein [Phycisphaerae bacterium]|nr:addiction module protein [Phycisphaerae bacterium]